MLDTIERLAFRIVSAGAKAIAAGGHLREARRTRDAADRLQQVAHELSVIQIAIDAYDRGDNAEVLRLLDGLIHDEPMDEAISRKIISDINLRKQ